MNLAPICLFVYNRPWHTKQTLDALSRAELAGHSDLYIFCDGPHDSSSEEELHAINSVHDLVSKIVGFKTVTYFKSNINKGLGQSIIGGVNIVFEKHETIIVLEDDHLVHRDFLKYMNFYLINYSKKKRIMHIGAFARNSWLQFFLPRVYVTRYMDCWGWGTWADSWKMLNLDFKLFEDYFSLEQNANRYNFNKLDHHTYLDNNRYELKTWAVFWHSTIAIHNGLTIMPKYSYVRNIGNDGSGTNEVVKTAELASNFINKFKPFRPKLKETLLSELYIQDAYAKRSKKRLNRPKKWLHDLISGIRNKIIGRTI